MPTVIRDRLKFAAPRSPMIGLGWAFFIYAAFIYRVLAMLFSRIAIPLIVHGDRGHLRS